VLKGERAPALPPARREAPAHDARPAKPARKPFGKRKEEKPFEKQLFAMPQNRDKNKDKSKKQKWRADAGNRPLTRGGGKPSRPGKR
jgi:hypothetical protein